MVLYDALDGIKRPEATIRLDIPLKPVLKELGHCEPSWRGIDTLIEAGQ
ncbi:unnamed protein product [marine sediment metagenome]|uniref:Uncharacterized protein n=1 Tax=marine sediment metagenome TaxID=412755 RepID=X1UXP3_9ZZZZ